MSTAFVGNVTKIISKTYKTVPVIPANVTTGYRNPVSGENAMRKPSHDMFEAASSIYSSTCRVAAIRGDSVSIPWVIAEYVD